MHAPPCAFCGAHGGTAGWKVASRTFRRRRSPCKTSRAAPVRRPRLVPVCVAQTEGPSKASQGLSWLWLLVLAQSVGGAVSWGLRPSCRSQLQTPAFYPSSASHPSLPH
jgi:hypothetical protein